jgi:hypothetical protein
MESESVIFIISFIITILSFYFRYFKPGTVHFHQPNTIYLYIIKEHFHLAFPLIAENTGASTHTVDFIVGRITQQNRKKSHNFTASRNLEGLSPPDEEIAPLFTSFSISPRISNTSVISLKSEKELSLTKGEYSFTLTANIDNKEVITLNNFINFKIDKQTKIELEEGNCRFLGYYSVLEERKIKKSKKKKLRIIQVCLLILVGIFALFAILSAYVQALKEIRIFGDFSFLALMLILLVFAFIILIWIKPITAEIKEKKLKINILRNLDKNQ